MSYPNWEERLLAQISFLFMSECLHSKGLVGISSRQVTDAVTTVLIDGCPHCLSTNWTSGSAAAWCIVKTRLLPPRPLGPYPDHFCIMLLSWPQRIEQKRHRDRIVRRLSSLTRKAKLTLPRMWGPTILCRFSCPAIVTAEPRLTTEESLSHLRWMGTLCLPFKRLRTRLCFCSAPHPAVHYLRAQSLPF